MKTRFLALTLCLVCLTLCAGSLGASAEEAPITVTVTIVVRGTLVVTQVPIELRDYDNNGELTANDALYGVHEKLYQGGADAGYGCYTEGSGVYINRLWGDEGGGYHCYVNHRPRGLSATLENGDHITAFVNKTHNSRDVYTHFEVKQSNAESGDPNTLTLTLIATQYDRNYDLVSSPLQGATIIIDGNETLLVTDLKGKVTLTLDEGDHVISAMHDGITIVPPAHVVSIPKSSEKSSCKGAVSTGLILLLPLAYPCIKRKEK